MMALCMATFTACGDDEEETSGGPGGGGSGSGGGTPTLPSVDNANAVTQLRYVTSWQTTEAEYTYTNGRMASGSDLVDNLDFVITYSPFTIVSHDGGYRETYKNIRTNAQGFITSMDLDIVDNEDPYGYVEMTYKISATYDADGHLTSYTESEIESYEGMEYRDDGTLMFTWQGGNLVKTEFAWEIYENGVLAESGHEDEYTISYGDGSVSNSGIYIPEVIPDLDFMCYAGFLGKPTKDIPTRRVDDADGYDVLYTNVDKDAKGRIVALHMQESRGGQTALCYGYADNPLAPLAEQASMAAPQFSKSTRALHKRGLRSRLKARKARR